MQQLLSIDRLNSASAELSASLLDGIYEHSPWIAQEAAKMRPFKSLAHLKHVLSQVVSDANGEAKLALIRAHPELAGKAMVSQSLTAESTNEQTQAGLTHCSPEQFAKLQVLNKQYNEKFGWPFILAVRVLTTANYSNLRAPFERPCRFRI
jgi:beta-ureidopropionase / N-carbamoyl-L-amino-acid hydrolase